MSAWYEDEAGFAAELARGRRAEIHVAARLLPLGLWLRVGSYWFREQLGKDPRAADQPDIQVEGNHLLEVKGRDLRFTGPDDYEYETAYVGAKRRWDVRADLPCAVVLLSEPTGALIMVPITSRRSWRVEASLDRRRGFVEESYAAPRNMLLPEAALLAHLQEPCTFR